MDIVSFLLAILLYVWIASAAFWAIATSAYASWSSLKSVPLWALIGGIVPVAGLIAAIIADIVTRQRNKSGYYPAATSTTSVATQTDSDW